MRRQLINNSTVLMSRNNYNINSQTRREPSGKLLEDKRESATSQATGNTTTTQSRKEPQGELLENGSASRSSKLPIASESTTHTRRDPQGELLEEGQRQQTLAHNSGPSSKTARTISLQKRTSPNPSKLQATPYSELQARLSNNDRPTDQDNPRIQNEIQSQPQREARRPSDASSIASLAAIANVQEHFLAGRYGVLLR